MPFFNTVPGLVPLKIYSGSTLLTTNVNLINFTGSGITTTIGAFNDLTVTISGGGGGSGSGTTTGSFTGSFTGSLLGTASYALNVLSASYAATASSANTFVVRNSLTASGLIYPTTDGTFQYQVMQTNAAGTLSFGNVETIFDTIYNGESTTLVKGEPVYVSGSQGANPKVYRADAANPSKMPVIYIVSENITTATTGRGITLGHIEGIDLTGYTAGAEVYVAAGGGWTTTRPTGSTIIQFLGLITKSGTGGKGLVLNPGAATLPNLNSGSVWVGNSGSYPIAVLTSSLSVASASYALSSSYSLTSSFATSASYASVFPYTGSAQITGSLGVTGSVFLRSGSNLIINNGLISASYGTTNLSVGGTPGWTSGVRNTAFGLSNQGSVTTQTDNTSLGYLSLLGGTQNTAIGTYTSQFNTGTGNTVIGYYALGNKVSDTSYNTAIGYQAMYNASGSGNQYNVAIGYNSLYNNTTGNYNIAIASLVTNTTGYQNIGLGINSLLYNTSGYKNIALGVNALGNNTIGYSNIAMGAAALQNNTEGYQNIGLGESALLFNSLGTDNIAMGPETMLYMTTGSRNVGIGTSVMRGGGVVQGINRFNNVAIGYTAMNSTVYSSGNTAIGVGTLAFAGATTSSATFNGDNNTALGYGAGKAIFSGIENITIGYRAGDVDNSYYYNQNSGSYNIFIGSLAGSTVGAFSQSFDSYNIGIGFWSNYALNNNGPYNVSLGDYTHSRLSSSAATRNTSIGSQAGRNIRSGFRNTSLGAQAGYSIQTGSYNIFIGDSAAYDVVSGSNNTIIGSIAGLSASLDNTLLIGTGTTQRIRINSDGTGFISGSLSIGNITSSSNTENTLTLYPPSAGGTGEGGQMLLAASGGLYTSASMIDNWQNQFRILKGTNTGGSTAGYFYMNLDNGNSQFTGAVTASAYSGLPNDYLYATRSGSSQTVGSSWANTDIVFNNNVVSKGISYNTGTGVASLTGGKVYRITARLAWGAAAVYNLQFSCYTSANTQIGPTVEIVQSSNGTNNISDGTLEFIYAPGSNTDIKIRTTGANTALSGETIRADLNTQFIIQQIA